VVGAGPTGTVGAVRRAVWLGTVVEHGGDDASWRYGEDLSGEDVVRAGQPVELHDRRHRIE
jgi:hypothetical protein